jgi:hypothetical protein
MIVKFTKDYTGRETAMTAYKAGTQADLPTAQALELVRLGVAREMWAEIGRMYDPPKAEPEPPVVVDVAVNQAQGFDSAKLAKAIIEATGNEQAPKAKKPRKGKKVKAQ